MRPLSTDNNAKTEATDAASKEFAEDVQMRVSQNAENDELKSTAAAFELASLRSKYSYNFSWLGVPIIQYPQDIVAMQEIIWEVKPDLIIETGIARGGSLIFYASMLELLGQGKVLGIDIDVRPHCREAVEVHPINKRIAFFEGSSIDEHMAERVRAFADEHSTIMVALDSNHTHDHVLRELELYAPLVSLGSYCVVFDTIIEDMPSGSFPDRLWDKGDNPRTAVWEFMKNHPEFEIDAGISDKLQITANPDGYLRRTRLTNQLGAFRNSSTQCGNTEA